MAEQEVQAQVNGTEAGKKSKLDKLKERKKKQKLNKQQRRQEQQEKTSSTSASKATETEDGDEDIIIEYISAPVDLDSLRASSAEPEQRHDEDDERPGLGGGLGFGGGGLGFGGGGLGLNQPEEENNKPSAEEDAFEELKKVFGKFARAEVVMGLEKDESDEEDAANDERIKDEKKATTSKADDDSDEDEDELAGVKRKLSKKQHKLLNRMKIADLKKLCERPEVVEVWDVTAPDPPCLVYLKARRNTVPVPRHWSTKRKYLQGKRGLEKPPFKLPEFIEATGITQMRNQYAEKEGEKKLKQKLRDRMAPKMGKMDIDYQVLHDAFFRHQKPPPLTQLGELYYEGKEFEARITNARPGILSEALREALGMQHNTPPPWLINMQRYGPPPSYPNLKIAGLNAPIPPSCQFGYHAGGWGKPPVDEEGNALYGDVFAQLEDNADSDDEVDRGGAWGALEELESEEEEDETEDADEEEEDDEDAMAEGIASGLTSGMVSGMASGIASSLPSGIETPDTINLRKQADDGPRQLYQVLEQKNASVGAHALMGSDHVYVIPGADKKAAGGKNKPDFLKGVNADVEVTISPEELEGLDEDQVRELYESRVAEMRSGGKREDFSDMVAAKAAQQKRKIAQKAEAKAAKKAKGDTFKF